MADGTGDGEENRSPARERTGRNRPGDGPERGSGGAWLGGAGLSLVLFSRLIEAGVVKVPTLLLGALLVLVVLFEYALPRPRALGRTLLARLSRRLPDGLRPVAFHVMWALAGAASVMSGWTMAAWGENRLSECPPPAELPVMVSPESRPAVETAAVEFQRERARGRRCRPVHVTVFESPSATRLNEAFAHGWVNPPARSTRSALAEYGPQPVVWIPQTSAVIDFVRNRVRVRRLPSVASSPVVLVLNEAAHERLSGDLSVPLSWSDLLERAEEADVPLLRPDPDVGGAGIAATLALYAGRATGSAADADARRQREQRVTRVGSAVTDALDVLCRIRQEGPSHPPTALAAIVPEHTITAYHAGLPLGGQCDQRVSEISPLNDPRRVTAVYPTDRFELDYPYVEITWSGTPRTDPDRPAALFHEWLAGRRLLGQGFRTPKGDPGDSAEGGLLWSTMGVRPEVDQKRGVSTAELTRTIVQIDAARRPSTVLFALDRSDTMDRQTGDGTFFHLARGLIDDALARIGSADRAGLWTFPRGPAGRDPEPVIALGPADAPRIDAIRERLHGSLETGGSTTPLYRTVVAGVRELGDDGVLVVFTDGDNDDPAHEKADRAALDRELAGRAGPRVLVVAVDRRGCGSELAALAADHGRFGCLAAGTGGRERLISELFTRIWEK